MQNANKNDLTTSYLQIASNQMINKKNSVSKVLEWLRSLSSKCNQTDGLQQITQFTANKWFFASFAHSPEIALLVTNWRWWVWNVQLLHNWFATMQHNFSFITLIGLDISATDRQQYHNCTGNMLQKKLQSLVCLATLKVDGASIWLQTLFLFYLQFFLI